MQNHCRKLHLRYPIMLLSLKRGKNTSSELALKSEFSYSLPASNQAPSLDQNDKTIKISTDNVVQLSFSKENGLLTSLKVKGKELLTNTERDYLFDFNLAWID